MYVYTFKILTVLQENKLIISVVIYQEKVDISKGQHNGTLIIDSLL